MVSLVARFYDAWVAVLDGVATGNDTITSGQIDVFCGRGEHALSSAIRKKINILPLVNLLQKVRKAQRTTIYFAL